MEDLTIALFAENLSTADLDSIYKNDKKLENWEKYYIYGKSKAE